MATDDGGERLGQAERHLLELLAVLAGEPQATRADFSAQVVRRARRQQDTRVALLAGSGLLISAFTGVSAALVRAAPEAGGR